MRLRTLGDLKLDGDAFSRPKPLLLLSYLSLEGSQERRHLAELFYPGSARPLGSLASELTRIRKALPGAIGTSEERAWCELEIDARELLDALEGGDPTLALELYRGRFLDGLHLKDWGAELEEWVYGTREFIANRVRESLIKLAENEASQQAFARAAELAERAYFLSGAPEPEPEELGRIHTLLIAGGSARAGEVRKEAASFGITLEIDKEAARSMLAGRHDAEQGTTSGLPEVGTSFVGRTAELLELTELLSQQEMRLLTLAAPGGVGKTRLALQLARNQQGRGRFPDGVFFVALEVIANPSMLARHIATELGLTHQDSGEPLAQVVRFVGDMEMLLLLDNFEHLLESATIVSELVLACPNLKVVVTSRVRLNLVEEFVFPLEGLIRPPSHDAPSLEEQYRDATELFAQRAKSASLRFSLTSDVLPDVLRICELVGGAPLGIELAAAWVRMMPVAEITEEIAGDLDFLSSSLRNASERQKSLRVVFEHSWRLLTVREQEALRKLSVFRGGFRREAAAEVAAARIPVLASLADKSLLRVLPSGRYDRHPLVFQYTGEKLAEHPAEEALTRERHGRYMLSLVEAGEPRFGTAAEGAWLAQLDEEISNIRAALEWMQTNEEIEFGLRLAGALWWYWRVRGHIREGLEWSRSALAHPAAGERTAARAQALTVAANLYGRVGDFAATARLAEESVGIWRELGDDRNLALALLNQGNAMKRLGDPEVGLALMQEGSERARKAGDHRILPQILGNLGSALDELGERDRAKRTLHELMEISQATENTHMLPRALAHGLGRWAMEAGEYDRARSYLEEALALARSMGDEDVVPEILLRQQALSYRMGEYAAARSLGETCVRQSRKLGNVQLVGEALGLLGEVHLAQGEVQRARALFEESHGIMREMGMEAGIAEARIRLGNVDLLEGNEPEARSLLTEGLSGARALRHGDITAQALLGLGALARARGDLAVAKSHLDEGLALLKGRDVRGVASTLHGLGLVATAQGDEVSARVHFVESLELYRTLGDRHGVAQALEGFATSASRVEPRRAARLWGAAEAIREAVGAPLVLEDRRRFEREVGVVRGALGEDAFTSAWAAGRELPLEEAVALALEGGRDGAG